MNLNAQSEHVCICLLDLGYVGCIVTTSRPGFLSSSSFNDCFLAWRPLVSPSKSPLYKYTLNPKEYLAIYVTLMSCICNISLGEMESGSGETLTYTKAF